MKRLNNSNKMLWSNGTARIERQDGSTFVIWKDEGKGGDVIKMSLSDLKDLAITLAEVLGDHADPARLFC